MSNYSIKATYLKVYKVNIFRFVMVEDTKIDAERRRDLNQERTPREDFD